MGGNTFIAEEDAKLYRENKELQGERLEQLEKVYGRECVIDYCGQWIDTHLWIYEAGGNICKDQLNSVKYPTLIIHGNKDEVVPEYHPDFIAKNIPNSEVHKFKEAGHEIHGDPEHVDELHHIIEQFL